MSKLTAISFDEGTETNSNWVPKTSEYLWGHSSEEHEHSKFKMGLDSSSCRTITFTTLFPRQSQSTMRSLEQLKSLIPYSSE